MSPEELVDLFAPFGPVQVRRMFGGVGVFADGLMFALQARDELYLKVDAAFSARLAALGSSPFGYATATRAVTLPYWRLPDEALDDEDLRRELFRAAFQVARAAAARKAKSPGKANAPGKAGKAADADATARPAQAVVSAPPDLDELGLGGGSLAKTGRAKLAKTKLAKPKLGKPKLAKPG